MELSTENCNNTGNAVPVSVNSVFLQPGSQNQIRIDREFHDTTKLMAFVGVYDAYLVNSLVNEDVNFVPSHYQVIAADVNQDGAITTEDVSIIDQRAVLLINNFPHYKDWVFVDSVTSNNHPTFQLSSSFPLDDILGYSRNRVPVPESRIPSSSSYAQNCNDIVNMAYEGILPGDVSANYDAHEYLIAGQNNTQSVVFNLKEVAIIPLTPGANRYILPVYVTSDSPIYSIDFDLAYACMVFGKGYKMG